MMGENNQRKILVLGETMGREIAPITLELLRVGRELSLATGAHLGAALLGNEIEEISTELSHFSDEVYFISNKLLAVFQADFYTQAWHELCCRVKPDIVLLGHTLDNLDVAPRLACKLKAQLVSDCIHLEWEPKTGNLLCTKPVYGGNAVATFEIGTKPALATLRHKVVEPIERSLAGGKVNGVNVDLEQLNAKVEIMGTVLEENISLDKADAIVAGGRGIGRIEGLKLLEELTEALRKYFNKVEVGASRPVIDNGWLPPSRQLGLTGEKASPQLYVAIGISGSSQHLSGVSGSKKIVAINKDPRAPIFKLADYGVVGEYEGVVPSLVKRLKELP